MLRSTQLVSSRTVLSIQTSSAAKIERAEAACLRSSFVNRRTMTLVSTAVMALLDFAGDRPPHLRGRFRFPGPLQAASHFLQPGLRKPPHGAQQHTLRCLLNGEFRPRQPGPGVANRLGENHLAFCREP